MRELLRRVHWLLHRERFDHELEQEMRHHLALKAEDAGGDSAAIPQFGNITLWKEDSRNMWAFAFWEQLAQDVRYTLRTMAANKLFTAMAVVSLALGIGANTAIYSFMDAILLRSLPVEQPGQLAAINWISEGRPAVVHGMSGYSFRNGKSGMRSPNLPFAAYEMFRESHDIASDVFASVPAFELNVVAAIRPNSREDCTSAEISSPPSAWRRPPAAFSRPRTMRAKAHRSPSLLTKTGGRVSPAIHPPSDNRC